MLAKNRILGLTMFKALYFTSPLENDNLLILKADGSCNKQTRLILFNPGFTQHSLPLTSLLYHLFIPHLPRFKHLYSGSSRSNHCHNVLAFCCINPLLPRPSLLLGFLYFPTLAQLPAFTMTSRVCYTLAFHIALSWL